MNPANSSRSRLSAGLRAAAAALLLVAIVAAGTALIVRCITEVAALSAEAGRNGR